MKRVKHFTASNGGMKVVITMEVITTAKADMDRPSFIDFCDEMASRMFLYLGDCGFRLTKIKQK